MDLQKVIDEYKGIALSDVDLFNLVSGMCTIIRVPNIYKYKSIDEMLDGKGACFILYEWAPHTGHWCCLTLHGNDLEFYDPYGGIEKGKPDAELNNIPNGKYKRDSHQDKPYLTYLLLKCNYNLSYNEFKFQKLDKRIKDCGRWCSARILFKMLPLEEFKKLFYGPYSDDIVTIITANRSQLENSK